MKQLSLTTAIVFFSALVSAETKPLTTPNSLREETSSQALLVELTGKDISKENDITLYSEMVSAYQGGNEIAFKSRLQRMLLKFPQSPYADNALFVAGRMAVDNNNYAEAIRYFSQIEKNYPTSNKLIAAKFAKAMTYKKMNLSSFAAQTLREVRVSFPGSPESFRADAELKIMK